jgi:hypothetical protein
MKNKYWVAGLCLLVLMLCLVSACGGGASSTSPGSTTTASASPSTSPSTSPSSSTSPTTSPSPSTSPTQTMTTSSAAGSSAIDILGRGASIASIYYEMTADTAGQTTTVRVWQKNNKKVKEELAIMGVTTDLLLDIDARIMYTYMPDQNMAIKTTLDASQIPQSIAEENTAIQQYNPTIIGTETIDGKSCTIITWNAPTSGTVKDWVWTEKGFPLKMEVTANDVTTTIEFKNLDFSDIPDSTFELPKDVQIINQ